MHLLLIFVDFFEDRKILHSCGTRSLITFQSGSQPRHEPNRDCNRTSDDRVPYRLDPADPGQYKQRVHAMNTRFCLAEGDRGFIQTMVRPFDNPVWEGMVVRNAVLRY